MSIALAIEVSPQDVTAFSKALAEAGVTHSDVEGKAFDGGAGSALIVALTATIVPALVKVFTAYVESKKHIKIKYKGVEIQGVSEARLLDLIEKTSGAAAELDKPARVRKASDRKPGA